MASWSEAALYGLTSANGSLSSAINSLSSQLGIATKSTWGVSPLTYVSGIAPTNSNNSGWALCREDGSVIELESVLRVDVDSSNQVMQAPVEQGAFAMYNKAVGPTTVDLQVAIKGDVAKRAELTKLLLDLSGTTELLTLITPEMEFSGYNLESAQYSRKIDDGVDIIYFDLGLIEVRQVAAQYGNAKVAKPVNKGKQNGKESALHGLFDYF